MCNEKIENADVRIWHYLQSTIKYFVCVIRDLEKAQIQVESDLQSTIKYFVCVIQKAIGIGVVRNSSYNRQLNILFV